jgi:uncharacterized OB-fold protein
MSEPASESFKHRAFAKSSAERQRGDWMSRSRYEPAPVGATTALLAAICLACRRVTFPAPQHCPACGGQVEPTRLSGPATLSVLTAVLSPPPGALVAAPYDVGVADFAAGIRIIGLVDGPAERGDLVEPVVLSPYEGGETFGFRRPPAGGG